MKLQSVTEFILLRSEDLDAANPELYKEELLNIKRYAEFLTQPLALWQFIPCTPEGVPMEEPEKPTELWNSPEQDSQLWADYNYRMDAYNQAKDRCYFKGFEYVRLNNGFMVRNAFFKLYHYDFESSKVEDLLRYGSPIELTPAAEKLILGN